jgi:DNA-binding NarL/FixJ family response regulator
MQPPIHRRAVLVEDNPAIREQLIETLADLTDIRVVHTVDTEAEACQWMISNLSQWDVAIVDIFLRRGNGLNVLEAIRKRPGDKRVVVLTNFATDDMRRRAQSLGADRMFDKSTDLELLIDYCKRLGEAPQD